MSGRLAMIVLLVNVASTLVLVGLIWFVQVVHYPLFARIGMEEFSRYHAAHTRATTRVVALPMLAEAVRRPSSPGAHLPLARPRPAGLAWGW